MKAEEVRAAIVSAVSQMQRQTCRDVPPLRGDTKLIGDVPGFDSLSALELAILLTETLGGELCGQPIPDCLILGGGKYARPTVDELAESIVQFAVSPPKTTVRRDQSPDMVQSSNGEAKAYLNGQ